jgi:hypothetical protein
MPDNLIKRFNRAFATLAAAARAANAVDSGHAPRTNDLKELGIDPVAFKSIRR